MSLSPSLAAQKLTRIQRIRRLPVPGQINVQPGDTVTAETIVATAELPGDVFVARIAETVGLEPREVSETLTKQVGDPVIAGELLFQHHAFFGFIKCEYRSPVSGQVELIVPDTGHMVIRGEPRKLQLSAYLGGQVNRVAENREVVIETTGAFLQGVLGVGGEACGTLEILPAEPYENLKLAHLPQSSQGKILVGGTAPSHAVLERLAAEGARGLVVGSIADDVLTGFLSYELQAALTGSETVPFTLILTEGFGNIPMKLSVMTTLLPLAGKEAAINGRTQVRAGAVRPELIVPYKPEEPYDSTPLATESSLYVAQTVRLVRAPYLGRQGEIIELPEAPHTLPNGVTCRVAQVALDDGELVTVPRANLEI